jgi:hypothetical protein
MSISRNQEQRLFVIPCGKGCSCLGFDNCLAEASQLALLLGAAKPDPVQIGSMGQYNYYRELIGRYSQRTDLNQRTWFDPGTPDIVADHLERARLKGQRLRLFFGDPGTGKCWLEENDVTGYIGRSMGPMRIPILLTTKSSSGGGAILTRCIVRLMDTASRQEIWRHSGYRLPELQTKDEPGDAKHPCAVHSEGSCIARFTTPQERSRWMAFMRGETMRP